jgi:dCTP diphosphatase
MAIESIEELTVRLREFAKARDWDQFHSPKNLSMALSVESSELVEIFQWLSEEGSEALDDDKHSHAAEELADIFAYTVRLADKLNIDLWNAVTKKIEKNEAKYPADVVRGSSKKYTEY